MTSVMHILRARDWRGAAGQGRQALPLVRSGARRSERRTEPPQQPGAPGRGCVGGVWAGCGSTPSWVGHSTPGWPGRGRRPDSPGLNGLDLIWSAREIRVREA